MNPASALILLGASGLLAPVSASTAPGIADLAALVSQLPRCAVGCLQSIASQAGCAMTDLACLCDSREKFISGLTPCVMAAGCSLTELTEAAKLGPAICLRVSSESPPSDLASASDVVTAALSSAAATSTVRPLRPATQTAAAGRPAHTSNSLLDVLVFGLAITFL